MSKKNKNNDETSGFRNYDKFLEGYHIFSDYFTDGFSHKRENKSEYHNEDGLTDETKAELIPIATALVKGAVALQFIGDRDFYFNNDDMEVMIKFKKDYNNMTKEEITFNLMKDVILLLEKEEQQLIRIANAYDQKE
ncbi:hypothetical protein DSECCO2_587100 [anaerobic digester metagenome]|jgi:hypothetical protein